MIKTTPFRVFMIGLQWLSIPAAWVGGWSTGITQILITILWALVFFNEDRADRYFEWYLKATERHNKCLYGDRPNGN